MDVLVLNATGPQSEAPLAAVGWRDHLDQLDFFVKGPVLLGRVVLPRMRERGWGRIVQVDSEVVDRPPPGRSAYAASKAAQIGLTRAWARELAADGITVTRSRRASCRWSDTPTSQTPSATPTSPLSPQAASAPPPRSPTRSARRNRAGSLCHGPAARRRRRPQPGVAPGGQVYLDREQHPATGSAAGGSLGMCPASACSPPSINSVIGAGRGGGRTARRRDRRGCAQRCALASRSSMALRARLSAVASRKSR